MKSESKNNNIISSTEYYHNGGIFQITKHLEGRRDYIERFDEQGKVVLEEIKDYNKKEPKDYYIDLILIAIAIVALLAYAFIRWRRDKRPKVKLQVSSKKKKTRLRKKR